MKHQIRESDENPQVHGDNRPIFSGSQNMDEKKVLSSCWVYNTDTILKSLNVASLLKLSTDYFHEFNSFSSVSEA